LYQKVKAVEKVTCKRKCSTSRGRNRRASQAAMVTRRDVQDTQEENQPIIREIIEDLSR
jgi:hypothetical protein